MTRAHSKRSGSLQTNSMAFFNNGMTLLKRNGKSRRKSRKSMTNVQTLFENSFLSVPGLRESIQEGLKTPVKACKTKLHW